MKLIKIATYLVGIAQFIVILPVMVGIYSYSFLSKELKILLGGLTVMFILDIVLFFFPELKNTFLYGFNALDIVTYSWMFSMAIYQSGVRKIIRIGIFLFLLLIAFDAFFWSGLKDNGYSNALGKVWILGIAIYYLIQLLRDLNVVKLSEQPLFWISVGIVTNNAIGLIDIFSNPMLVYSQNIYLQFYMIWSIAAIFMYCCFAYAFWKSQHD